MRKAHQIKQELGIAWALVPEHRWIWLVRVTPKGHDDDDDDDVMMAILMMMMMM